MVRINVEGERAIECVEGRRLVLCLADGGIDILHRCGGNAKCTTCRVDVLGGDPGPMNDAEKARLAQEENLTTNTRLSCQIRVLSDIDVRVINTLSTSGLPDPGPRPEEWPMPGMEQPAYEQYG